MYDWNDSEAGPSMRPTPARMLNEPLTEIARTRGPPTPPRSSPHDEFANFEIFDHLITWPNIKGKQDGSTSARPSGGLVIQAKAGANPISSGWWGRATSTTACPPPRRTASPAAVRIDPKTMLPKGREARVQTGMIKVPACWTWTTSTTTPAVNEDTLMFSSGA